MDEAERTRFEALLSRIPSGADSILDVGCARHSQNKREKANLHQYIIEHSDAEVLGIDIMEKEIEQMKEDGFNVRKGNAETFSMDEKFDVIAAGELIEHLGRPAAFLERCEKHLKPQGKIILTTPNPDGFAYFRKAITGKTGNPTHTCWIDPRNLEQLVSISDSNLCVTETTYLPPTGGISHILWKCRRERAGSPNYVASIKHQSENKK